MSYFQPATANQMGPLIIWRQLVPGPLELSLELFLSLSSCRSLARAPQRLVVGLQQARRHLGGKPELEGERSASFGRPIGAAISGASIWPSFQRASRTRGDNNGLLSTLQFRAIFGRR